MNNIWQAMATLAACMATLDGSATFEPRLDIGVPAGLIPECPGVMKNVTISARMLPKFQMVLHTVDKKGVIVKKSSPITLTAKSLAGNKAVDFKRKKTVLYACGFFDSAAYPTTQAVAAVYARRGYNVLVTETFNFLTKIYPLSVRLARALGTKIGELLVKLTEQGLSPENIELVGISLGAHIVGYAAKHLYKVTGKKPSRITGLDPAGPCFRSLSRENRLDSSDAERVDILHTNIDGFGIANRLGHVDFYANGGEYQPGDIQFLPCLIMCSHIRSLLYFWQALEHPKKFIGVQCESVQEARIAKCYNSSVTNYLGLETKFHRPGIFYLPTFNEFPYYRGKEGLVSDNEIYTSISRNINIDDNLVV